MASKAAKRVATEIAKPADTGHRRYLLSRMRKEMAPVMRLKHMQRMLYEAQMTHTRKMYAMELHRARQAQTPQTLDEWLEATAERNLKKELTYHKTMVQRVNQARKRQDRYALAVQRRREKSEAWRVEAAELLNRDVQLFKEMSDTGFITEDNLDEHIENQLNKFVGLHGIRSNSFGLRPLCETREGRVVVMT